MKFIEIYYPKTGSTFIPTSLVQEFIFRREGDSTLILSNGDEINLSKEGAKYVRDQLTERAGQPLDEGELASAIDGGLSELSREIRGLGFEIKQGLVSR